MSHIVMWYSYTWDIYAIHNNITVARSTNILNASFWIDINGSGGAFDASTTRLVPTRKIGCDSQRQY